MSERERVEMSVLGRVRWDARGLVVAVAQDARSGLVQMVAWMNAEALRITLTTHRATFFSRSRDALWTKGETSGHHLDVESVHLDCDGDTVLLRVHPHGPSCHTGEDTCFFTPLTGVAELADVASDGPRSPIEAHVIAAPTLATLERDVAARKTSDEGQSYTKSLLSKGVLAIGDKLREEADELARALEGESNERVAAEAADVVYHLMVGLAARGVAFDSVLGVLEARRGISGHDEKRRRKA